MKPTLTDCRSVTELLSRAQEERISPADRAAIRLHQLICPGCRAFEKNAATLRAVMSQYGKTESPDADQHGRDDTNREDSGA